MEIIIDGYNLLNECRYGYPFYSEEARDALISDLCRYKRIKRASITVVFDAQKTSNLQASSYTDKGIRLIFTMHDRTADEEICSMIGKKGTGAAVVSSDGAIRKRVEKLGAVCIEAGVFAEKMREAVMYELKGTNDYEEMYREKPTKGPSRKPSKKERKRRKLIHKL